MAGQITFLILLLDDPNSFSDYVDTLDTVGCIEFHLLVLQGIASAFSN